MAATIEVLLFQGILVSPKPMRDLIGEIGDGVSESHERYSKQKGWGQA